MVCFFIVLNKVIMVVKLFEMVLNKIYLDFLCDFMKRLWIMGDYFDVIIEVGEKIFNCYKSILVVMLLYFDVMFSLGMCESISG